MRPAVVVLSAISTIEITTIRHVKAALQRSAIEKTLTRFQNVIAGKFTADFIEALHAMKEHAAYDNLPAKQSRWGISLHNGRDLLGDFQQPPDKLPAISRASAIPGGRQFPFSSNGRSDSSRGADIFKKSSHFNQLAKPSESYKSHLRQCGHRLVALRQKFGQNRKVLHSTLRGFLVGLNIDNVGRR